MGGCGYGHAGVFSVAKFVIGSTELLSNLKEFMQRYGDFRKPIQKSRPQIPPNVQIKWHSSRKTKHPQRKKNGTPCRGSDLCPPSHFCVALERFARSTTASVILQLVPKGISCKHRLTKTKLEIACSALLFSIVCFCHTA